MQNTKRNLFIEATKDGIMTSKTFWRTFKTFLTNDGCIYNNFTCIEKD